MRLRPGIPAVAAVLALMFLATSTMAGAGSPTPQLLLPGTTVERQLAATGVHAYEIDIPAGRFLGVRVEQRGIDVIISILDPGGAVLRRHDSPSGDLGVESVSLIAARGARYRIEVSSFDPRAFPGGYVLSLDGPRPPGPRDEARIAAEKEFEATENLFDQGTASSLAAAQRGYLRVAGLFAPIDKRQEAIALDGAAQTARMISPEDRAQKLAERALAAARSCGDRRLESRCLGNLAFHEFLREGRPEALDLLRQAIAIDSSPAIRSSQLANLAYFHWVRGQYDDALAENRRTLEIARSAGSRLAEATALKNLAQVYWSLGQPRRALDFADEAVGVIHGVPEGHRLEALVLVVRGRIWRALDDPDRSLTDLEAAVELQRRIGDRHGEGWGLTEIAGILHDRGSRREARERADSALALSSAIGESRAQVRELTLLGQIELDDSHIAEARRRWEEALDLSRSVADRPGESSVLFAMARASRTVGELETAVSLAERALDTVDSLRTEIALPDLRVSYGASTEKDRRLPAEILIALDQEAPGKGFAQRAFEAMERARARALTEAIAQGRLAPGGEIPPALRDRSREASARIAFLQRRIAEASASERGRLLSELGQAEEDFDRIVVETRRSSPRAAALRYPQPLTAGEAQTLLSPGEALISYASSDDRLFAFLLTRTTVRLIALPADCHLLTSRVENFAELVSRADPTVEPLAGRLCADLFEPVRAALPPGIHRLVIVPDGPLHSLPFEALPARPGAPDRLIEDFAISYAPSATVLAALSARRSEHGARSGDLIAFADPVSAAAPNPSKREAPPFERIPGAIAEASAAVRYASLGSKLYTGANASEAQLKRESLNRYRILHLATHSVVSLENPGLSALILAHAPGDGEDGLLRAREISGLDLDSDLIVLSGCETARGRLLPGEGVQSLARAFFLAGARSVIASLWKVRDQATERLMTAFYRRLAEGQPKDEALRGAKLEMSRDRRNGSPRDWASFILMGEPTGRVALTPRP